MFVCLDLFIKMVGSGYPVFQVFSLTSLGLGNNSYTNVLWVFFAATAGLMTIKLYTSKAPAESFIEIKL